MAPPRTFFLAALLLAPIGAVGYAAENSRPIARGTEGVVAIPFAATNEGADRIGCAVSVAHWYWLDLGEAGQGEAVRATLWFDPASGEISILNAVQDRMPVMALWCGLAGRSWATRSPVPLSRRTGERPAPIALACARDGERLACR